MQASGTVWGTSNVTTIQHPIFLMTFHDVLYHLAMVTLDLDKETLDLAMVTNNIICSHNEVFFIM